MPEGRVVLEILRHAAGKEAEANAIRQAIRKEKSPRRRVELAKDLKREDVKRKYRVRAAALVAGAGATVRLCDLEGNLVVEGVLVSVDPAAGTIGIERTPGEAKLFTYVESLPIPEDLVERGQRYYGVKLLLGLELVSFPRANAWMLD